MSECSVSGEQPPFLSSKERRARARNTQSARWLRVGVMRSGGMARESPGIRPFVEQ